MVGMSEPSSFVAEISASVGPAAGASSCGASTSACCEDGRTLTEEELCRITHNPPQATHYALSVLDRFGVVPSETEGAAR